LAARFAVRLTLKTAELLFVMPNPFGQCFDSRAEMPDL
jgi:hypothetical protein